jgi:tetratricopeptide (TPR) repeat protein
VALLENDRETALKEFQAATAAEGAGPRAWLELGRLTKDSAQAIKDFEKALELNPAWAEAHIRIAERVDTANKRGFALQKAAAAEPRNKAVAIAAAQALEEAGRFEDAVKMWRLAERAAANQAEKDDLLRLQRESEERRQTAAADERRRKSEAEKAELDRLRNEALARIKAAENKANQSAGAMKGSKPEKWWDAPPATKISGTFERLECGGGRARMILRGADGKPIALSIADPSKVVIEGGGEKTLGCGIQKPPRRVNVEYLPKHDAKAATAGEVSLIEFP